MPLGLEVCSMMQSLILRERCGKVMATAGSRNHVYFWEIDRGKMPFGPETCPTMRQSSLLRKIWGKKCR